MDIIEYMEGYDRYLDRKEFDDRLWEGMQSEDFELSEEFEDLLRDWGIADLHTFLRERRIKLRINQ